MQVFLSWSGPHSRALAEALHSWLPRVVQALRPWLSSEDIQAGARWGAEVATRLEATSFGVLCLTPDNLNASWLMFEAGALSRTVATARVCPYLLGVEAADLQGPLAQFQAIPATRDPTYRLIRTLNAALGEASLGDEQVLEAFDVWWPRLEAQLAEIRNRIGAASVPLPSRTTNDLLSEILELVRAQERRAQQADLVREVGVRLAKDSADEFAPGEGYPAIPPDRARVRVRVPTPLPLNGRVRHRRFGPGTVVRCWGDGIDSKVTVEFDDPAFGTKSLLLAHAPLELIPDAAEQ